MAEMQFENRQIKGFVMRQGESVHSRQAMGISMLHKLTSKNGRILARAEDTVGSSEPLSDSPGVAHVLWTYRSNRTGVCQAGLF
jgi:hypothetical protein